MQVILIGSGVPLPCYVIPSCYPVIGRQATGFGISPYIPIAFGIIARRARLEEQGMLIGGVVGYVIHDYLETALMGLCDEQVKCRQVAESRVDIDIVAYVVTQVDHGRGVDGR